MLITRETTRSVTDAQTALEEACARHAFGVLGVHDLGAKLRDKGLDFTGECIVVEVCNPVQAARVLAVRPEVATALPCRVSIHGTPTGARLATLRPTLLLGLFDAPEVGDVAAEVERTLTDILEDAVA